MSYKLYVNVVINGVTVRAFVDSGAQTTIMSQDCAVRTGLIGLVDPRFAGTAIGVGATRIIGKVHLISVDVDSQSYKVSFSVLSQSEDEILIGIDFLKRYQCSIDLAKNCLHFGTTGQSVPFLPDDEDA